MSIEKFVWFFSDGSGRSFGREERMREDRRGGEMIEIVGAWDRCPKI